MPPLPTDHRWPSVHRSALLIFFLTCMLVGGRQVIWYWSHGPVVSDLRIFMTGVEILRSGHGHELYRFDAQQAVQNRLYPATRQAGLLPFNHLAYELLIYWPLAGFSYRTALIAWGALNLGLAALIAWLIAPQLRTLRSTTGVPLFLWLVAFYPVLFVFGEGQDSLLSLTLIALSLRCFINQRMFLAGLVLALTLFKFHLAVLIAFFVFVLPRTWRALAGFGAGVALVVGISRVMVGPSFAHDYFYMLRNQDVMTPWGFVPWFMPNLRGLLQWALAPRLDIGDILPIILLASLAVIAVASWILFHSKIAHSPALLYSVAILTTSLVSFHLHMQDLTLAALPMLFLLESALRGDLSRALAITATIMIVLLYAFRLAAEPFPILLVRGCLMAIPTFGLWVVSLAPRCQPAKTEHFPS